jgi:hypothetical protein
MKRILMVLALAFSLNCSAKECGECCGKHYTQKAADVQFRLSADEMSITHHAYYLGGEVITVWQGTNRGDQVIYIFGKPTFSFNRFKEVGDSMVHYYDGFKVCSSPTSQWIRTK